MNSPDRDQQLSSHDERLRAFKRAAEEWARRRDAWSDTHWPTWEHRKVLERPWGSSALLCDEGRLFDVITEHDFSWNALCDEHGFEFDFEDHITATVFSPDDAEIALVRRRAELQWLTNLVTADIATVYGEVYRWFAQHPEMMRDLHWRAFEELVESAFAGQGFTTKLGSGRNDRGVDLRLLEHEVLGDVMTVIQIKNTRRPVGLEVVQAVAAASVIEGGADAAIVTTSRFLPGAKRWADHWERQVQRQLTLAGPDDVARWCSAAWARTWAPENVFRDPTPRGTGDLIGNVVVASDGYGITTNQFGLVVRQTPSAIALRVLRSRIVQGDIQVGTEVPVVELPPGGQAGKDPVIVVAVRNEDGGMWNGTNGRYYFRWDGAPQHFNLMD